MKKTLSNPVACELVVHLTDDFGAMSRLMNTLRRRGFAIETMSAKRIDGSGYHVVIRIHNLDGGGNLVEALAKHIRNLVDVRSVQVAEP